ncbi:MAG: hypothetical protein OHK0022_24190 [Roseiflexaceae bacterium]
MPKPKQPTYEDHVELGRLLAHARDLLVEAQTKASNMYRKSQNENINAISIAVKQIDAIRNNLDSISLNDFTDTDIPEGKDRFPYYPNSNERLKAEE